MRCFLAVDLPDGLAEAVAAVQERFEDAAGLRFVDPAQAHVTLKFLGDVPEERVPAVESAATAAVDDAADGPFEVRVAGLGVFPSLDYVRVVWAGVEAGSDRLTRLAEAAERETTAAGFDPEEHAFTPHVTLARMDDARGKELVRRLVTETHPEVGSFRAEEVRLKRSVRGSDGPTYETVTRFRL